MPSRFKLLGILLLTTAIAGCGSTGSSSFDPAPGPGPVPVDPVDPPDPTDPTDPIGPTDPIDPTDPGGPTDPTDPTEPTPSDPTEHSLLGKFLRFSSTNAGDNDIVDGSITATVAADGQTADVATSAGGLGVPGSSGLSRIAGEATAYGASEDDFLDLGFRDLSRLDLGQSGQNYTIGTYVATDTETDSWYVGTAVGGERTPQDQIDANASYRGTARGALIPTSYDTAVGTDPDEIYPYALTGDAQLNLNVNGANATVDGAITNVQVRDLQNFEGGQITFQPGEVANGEYRGDVDVNLTALGVTATGTGEYGGAFYGENAAETAGTFEAEGNVNTFGTFTPYKVIGSFGAEKQ